MTIGFGISCDSVVVEQSNARTVAAPVVGTVLTNQSTGALNVDTTTGVVEVEK